MGKGFRSRVRTAPHFDARHLGGTAAIQRLSEMLSSMADFIPPKRPKKKLNGPASRYAVPAS